MTQDELNIKMLDLTEQMIKTAMLTITKIAKTEGTHTEYRIWAQNALDTIAGLEQQGLQYAAEFQNSKK